MMKGFCLLLLILPAVLSAAAPVIGIGEKALAPERFAAEEARRLFSLAPEAPDLVIGTPETNPEICLSASNRAIPYTALQTKKSAVSTNCGRSR